MLSPPHRVRAASARSPTPPLLLCPHVARRRVERGAIRSRRAGTSPCGKFCGEATMRNIKAIRNPISSEVRSRDHSFIIRHSLQFSFSIFQMHFNSFDLGRYRQGWTAWQSKRCWRPSWTTRRGSAPCSWPCGTTSSAHESTRCALHSDASLFCRIVFCLFAVLLRRLELSDSSAA